MLYLMLFHCIGVFILLLCVRAFCMLLISKDILHLFNCRQTVCLMIASRRLYLLLLLKAQCIIKDPNRCFKRVSMKSYDFMVSGCCVVLTRKQYVSAMDVNSYDVIVYRINYVYILCKLCLCPIIYVCVCPGYYVVQYVLYFMMKNTVKCDLTCRVRVIKSRHLCCFDTYIYGAHTEDQTHNPWFLDLTCCLGYTIFWLTVVAADGCPVPTKGYSKANIFVAF